MILSTIFVGLIIIAVFHYAADKKLKGIFGPLLPIFLGIITILSTISGGIGFMGYFLGSAFILLGCSDYLFDCGKENLFPVAMGLGLVSGLMIGIIFHISCLLAGVNVWLYLLSWAISIAAGLIIKIFVAPPKEFAIPVWIYIIQIMILMAGGIGSGFEGNFYFLTWGILLFISDSLVGIRQFPNEKRRIPGLTLNRILMLILLVYYTAMFVMVNWAEIALLR